MIFDGIITKCIVKELNDNILNGKVEKITMPNKLEINIHIYSNCKKMLCINCNSSENGIYLSTNNKSLPNTPPTFCMILRKYLQNNRIVNISQHMSDRIIIISFEGYNEMNDKEIKHLIIEIMGKHSNCILVNNEYMILDSLKHVDNNISSVRMVLPNLKYIYPKMKNNFLDVDLLFFKIILKSYSNNDITFALLNSFNGFSPLFINQLLEKMNIPSTTNIADLNDNEIEKIFNLIKEIYKSIDNRFISVKEIDDKNWYIDITNTNSNNLLINEKINNYYINYTKKSEFNNMKNNMNKIVNDNISKNNKKLKMVLENLTKCEKIDMYKIYGEIITANLYKKISTNSKIICLENFYDNNKPVEIPIDNRISLNLNAQKYFKNYSKLKTTLEYSLKEKEELETELSYLNSIIINIDNCNCVNDLENIREELYLGKYIKQTKKEKNKKVIDNKYITYEFNNFSIIVGKNNLQNDYITHKLSKNSDMWFHIQKKPGSHVIIQNSTKNFTDEVIKFAAELALFYSSCNQTSKDNIDYCNIKYVKKHPCNKPGMVAYTNFKTIFVSPYKHENFIKV